YLTIRVVELGNKAQHLFTTAHRLGQRVNLASTIGDEHHVGCQHFLQSLHVTGSESRQEPLQSVPHFNHPPRKVGNTSLVVGTHDSPRTMKCNFNVRFR